MAHIPVPGVKPGQPQLSPYIFTHTRIHTRHCAVSHTHLHLTDECTQVVAQGWQTASQSEESCNPARHTLYILYLPFSSPPCPSYYTLYTVCYSYPFHLHPAHHTLHYIYFTYPSHFHPAPHTLHYKHYTYPAHLHPAPHTLHYIYYTYNSHLHPAPQCTIYIYI